MNFLEDIAEKLGGEETFFTEDDVISIARVIGMEDNKDICSRIRYELSPDVPKDSPFYGKVPIIVSVIDVLNERYRKGRKNSDIPDLHNLHQLEKILKNCSDFLQGDGKEIYGVLEKQDKKSAILFCVFSRRLDKLKFHIETILQDPNKIKRLHLKELAKKERPQTFGGYTDWGFSGEYVLFIDKCACLYKDLSGSDFKVEFDRRYFDHFGGGLTEGVRFVWLFHIILNRMAKKCTCEEFSRQEFANVCEKVREAIRKRHPF